MKKTSIALSSNKKIKTISAAQEVEDEDSDMLKGCAYMNEKRRDERRKQRKRRKITRHKQRQKVKKTAKKSCSQFFRKTQVL